MAQAEFSEHGVTLALSKEEWWFITSAMSYALHGKRLQDHDFRNILMIDSTDAERLYEELRAAEQEARATGHHWYPSA